MTGRPPLSVRARLLAKSLTPPIAWSALKRAKDSRRPAAPPPAVAEPPPEWEYVPEGWVRPAGGWNAGAIAQAYREKWPSFLEATAGPGPLGVNHEVPAGVPVPREELDAQHVVLAFGYVLARAAHGRERLSLLDWGGGPGHYAALAAALLPEVELEYHSRDLPALVSLGRELQPSLAFHDDDACLGRRYDLVVASSSLQYSEDWRAAVAALAGATADWLYLARVGVARERPSFVVLQRAHAYGYETEYLGWVLNRAELLDELRSAGLELERELVFPERPSVPGAPESPIGHRGFLLRRSG